MGLWSDFLFFFDFIDPVLRDSVVNEFQSMYGNLTSFPVDDGSTQDPFDFKKLVSKDKTTLSKKDLARLDKFTKNYDANVYDGSANFVQIKAAMKKWKWMTNPGEPNFLKQFLMKYDMNYDGRLNPREFILGSLYENKQTVGSPLCEFCFFEIGKILDAIFMYLDCNNDGLLQAEEIWNNMSKLNRNSEKWNLFSFGNDENIRTAAVNDFILKNMKMKKGYLSRREFRVGILLGYWDRQTEFSQVLSDDSRNMKNLRWKEDDMVDIALYNYYKKKIRSTMK